MPDRTPRKRTPAEANGGGKANALQQPLQPSPELAAVVGSDRLSRGEVVSKVWDYIRAHNLQNPENRREILADDTLRKVFGKDKVTMFEMNKYLVSAGALNDIATIARWRSPPDWQWVSYLPRPLPLRWPAFLPPLIGMGW